MMELRDSYYFPHDSNARRDPKCSALLSDYGCGGYGVYWGIIEILHEQGGKIKKFPKLYEGIAHQFHMDVSELTKLIEAMLHDYELLLQDENYIWSDRVLRNIEERKNKFINRVEAGRIGGLRSGETRKTKQNEAVLQANEAVLQANEPKERKGKEIKGKERKEKDESTLLAELCASEAFKGIDIHRELSKAKLWCEKNNRRLTERFFINWLNRADVPISAGNKTKKARDEWSQPFPVQQTSTYSNTQEATSA